MIFYSKVMSSHIKKCVPKGVTVCVWGGGAKFFENKKCFYNYFCTNRSANESWDLSASFKQLSSMFIRRLENFLHRRVVEKTSFFSLFEVLNMGQNAPKNCIFSSFNHCRNLSRGYRNMLESLKDAFESQFSFALCFRTFGVQKHFLFWKNFVPTLCEKGNVLSLLVQRQWNAFFTEGGDKVFQNKKCFCTPNVLKQSANENWDSSASFKLLPSMFLWPLERFLQRLKLEKMPFLGAFWLMLSTSGKKAKKWSFFNFSAMQKIF